MMAAFTDRRIPLPEQTSLLAAVAAGTVERPAVPDREGAAARLREAFDRLGDLVERAHGIPSPLPAHDLLAKWYRVPARLLFDWPQPLADDIEAFGSSLAEAIRLAGSPDRRSTVDRLATDDVVQGEQAVDRTLKHRGQVGASLAPATLVWQWTLAYALTLGGDSWLTRSTLRLLGTPPGPIPRNRPVTRMHTWIGGMTAAGGRLPFLSGLSTMRAVSGLVAVEREGGTIGESALPDLRLSLSGSDDGRLALVDAIEPESLLSRGYPRAHLVYSLPEGHALVCRSDGSGIAVMSASGDLVGIEAWPLPVRASIPLGPSGRLAWHFPDAPRLLHRDLATERVETIELPVGVFDALARPDGSVCLATDAGLWTWTPGQAPEPLIGGPWLVSLHGHGDAVRACVRPARDEEGRWAATTELLEWQPGDTSFRSVPVGAGTAPFSVAEQAGWRAEAWLDGCVVRLVRRDGHVFWLACTGPRSLAWAGASLYVATVSGEVLRFPDIAARLAAR
jgi:hypothetical protein